MTGSERYRRTVALYRLSDRFGLSRYDIVLAVIPMAFLIVFAFGDLAGLSVRARIVGGALVAGLAVIDALFLNPPALLDGRTPSNRDASRFDDSTTTDE